MRGLMAYWYHFAIMFEALFILTTIDAGTRVGALPGRRVPRPRLRAVRAARLDARRDDLDAARRRGLGAISSGPAASRRSGRCSASRTSCWPSVALAVGTTIIINVGRARYAWVTLLPLSFVSVTTLTAGALSVRDNFWPMAIGPNAALHFQGYLDSVVTVVMMVCVLVILSSAVVRWVAVLRGRIAIVPDAWARRLELTASNHPPAARVQPRTSRPPLANRLGHLAVARGVRVQAVRRACEQVRVAGAATAARVSTNR